MIIRSLSAPTGSATLIAGVMQIGGGHSSLLISEQQQHTTLWASTAIIFGGVIAPALKHQLQICTNEQQDCKGF